VPSFSLRFVHIISSFLFSPFPRRRKTPYSLAFPFVHQSLAKKMPQGGLDGYQEGRIPSEVKVRFQLFFPRSLDARCRKLTFFACSVVFFSPGGSGFLRSDSFDKPRSKRAFCFSLFFLLYLVRFSIALDASRRVFLPSLPLPFPFSSLTHSLYRNHPPTSQTKKQSHLNLIYLVSLHPSIVYPHPFFVRFVPFMLTSSIPLFDSRLVDRLGLERSM